MLTNLPLCSVDRLVVKVRLGIFLLWISKTLVEEKPVEGESTQRGDEHMAAALAGYLVYVWPKYATGVRSRLDQKETQVWHKGCGKA